MNPLWLVASLVGCGGAEPEVEPAPAPSSVALVYNARQDGEIEPCG